MYFGLICGLFWLHLIYFDILFNEWEIIQWMSNKYRFFLNTILGLCIAELNLVIFHIKEFFCEKRNYQSSF